MNHANRCFHLMVVEDEPVDLYLVRRALEEVKFSWRLTTACNGEEALTVLEDLGKDLPDVILLDVNMPRMNGTETLRELKSHPVWDSIPVTMFTTSTWAEDRRLCTAWGADGYLAKPDSLAGYLQTLRTLRRLWLSMIAPSTQHRLVARAQK